MKATSVRTDEVGTAVARQQMQVLYSHFYPVLLANVASSIGFVAILWASSNRTLLLLWWFLFIAVLAVRFRLFGNDGPKLEHAPGGYDWVTIFAAGVAITALMWGLTGFLFFTGDPLIDMVISVFVLGVSMGSVTHVSRPFLPVTFSLACNLPVVMALFFIGDTFHNVLAVMIGFYLVGFTIVLFSINRLVVASIDRNVKLEQEVNTRKEMEEELLIQSIMLKNMTQGVYMVRQDGRILYANPRFESMFGYEKGELEGRHCSIINYPTERSPEETAQEILDILDETGRWEGEVNNIKKDGSPFWTHASVRSFDHSRYGKVLISVQTDITERRNWEQRLNMLSQVVEQTNEAVVITDRDANIQYTNPAYTALTGYPAHEVLGKNPRILKSGKQDERFYERMWRELTAGRSWQSKVINKRKDGSFYPALLTISPIFDRDQNIVNFAGIQQDLTEIDSLESKLLQAQKMEALGTLVGGIAHEFNNSLSGVISSLYLAKQEAAGNPGLIRRLDTIEKISFDSANLIKSMLQFSRKGILEKVVFEFVPFFREFLRLSRVSLPENIELVEDIKCSDCRIEGDANLLRQVLLNVVNNARDAVAGTDSPSIRVTLDNALPGRLPHELRSGSPEQSYLCITISDNGCGMSPELLLRVFEPFQTTKEVGKGTGLGLSMSYGVIQRHNGLITLDSVLGEGTDVRIFLPVIESRPAKETGAVEGETKALPGGGETILLVDDNEVVLNAGREILTSLGYRVMSVSSGEMALEEFRVHKDEIDLVLADVVMPGMSGVKLISEIQKIVPEVRFILTSGYDRDTLESHPGFDIEELVEKPFRVESLSKAVRAKLGNLVD